MSQVFGPEAVYIEREPKSLVRTYIGSITELDEEFEFVMTTIEHPGTGKPEVITEIKFDEAEPINKRSAIAIIKDNF